MVPGDGMNAIMKAVLTKENTQLMISDRRNIYKLQHTLNAFLMKARSAAVSQERLQSSAVLSVVAPT